MSAVAGRVLLLFMGDYDSATTYKPMDVVLYGVNSYVCLLESTGNVPTNTTYWQTLAKGISNVSPEALGIGYGISQNTGASKTATLADYTLTINGIVAVTFADDVPANATLNINSQGAKPIYYRGSALVANVIRGGDTVTFAYDGTHYDILCIDGGAGHEIENSAGTKLSQRDVMQVTDGLEAVDDSTNQKTKIKMNLPTISLADWNAMTEQEQEAYKASHYRFGVELPDTSGVINAEYMSLLWENQNTTQAFAAQNITLSSADYDFVLILGILATSNPIVMSVIVKKGSNSGFVFVSENGNRFNRYITYVSDTSLSVGGGLYNASADNTMCVPIAVYGIKKDFQFKVNAIATELSTRADHCFLDDEVTTVEDALTTTESQDLTTTATIKRYRNVRHLMLNASPSTDSSGKIVTVPEKDRPSKQTFGITYVNVSGTHYTGHIMVNADGNVYINTFIPGTTQAGGAPINSTASGSIMWIVD